MAPEFDIKIISGSFDGKIITLKLNYDSNLRSDLKDSVSLSNKYKVSSVTLRDNRELIIETTKTISSKRDDLTMTIVENSFSLIGKTDKVALKK